MKNYTFNISKTDVFEYKQMIIKIEQHSEIIAKNIDILKNFKLSSIRLKTIISRDMKN